MSPRASTSGWPGTERSPSTARRPARSTSSPACSASSPRQRRGGHARGPDDGPRRDPLGRLVRALHGDASVVDADHRLAERGRDPEVLQRAQRLGREALGEGRQDAIQRLDEQDARRSWVDAAEVARTCRGRSRRSGPPSRRPSARRRRRRRSAARPGARGRTRARPPRRPRGSWRRMVSAPSSDFSSAACSCHSSWPK